MLGWSYSRCGSRSRLVRGPRVPASCNAKCPGASRLGNPAGRIAVGVTTRRAAVACCAPDVAAVRVHPDRGGRCGGVCLRAALLGAGARIPSEARRRALRAAGTAGRERDHASGGIPLAGDRSGRAAGSRNDLHLAHLLRRGGDLPGRRRRVDPGLQRRSPYRRGHRRPGTAARQRGRRRRQRDPLRAPRKDRGRLPHPR